MSLERKWERPETILIEVTRTGNFVSLRIRGKQPPKGDPPQWGKEGKAGPVSKWLQEFLASWMDIEEKKADLRGAEFVAEVENMIRGMMAARRSAGRYRYR